MKTIPNWSSIPGLSRYIGTEDCESCERWSAHWVWHGFRLCDGCVTVTFPEHRKKVRNG